MKKGQKHSEGTKQAISDKKKAQGIVPKTAFKKGCVAWNKGLPAPWLSERNRKDNPNKRDDSHHFWKGDRASYRSIHRWVVRRKGLPSMCTDCGKCSLTGRQIHWANIDHKYRRNIDDYIRLCAKCHASYDQKNGLRAK